MPIPVHLKPLLSSVKAGGISAILIASALYFGCAAPSFASAKILKFSYILSPDSQIGGGERVFAAEIEARTAGRYRIEAYPNSMLGGEVAVLEDLRLGVLDLAFVTGSALPNVLPEAGVFNIPFLFRDADEARAVLDGPIGEDFLRKFDNIGFMALAWGENGMRHITNSKRPILVPDDLAGLKIRLPESTVMTTGFRTFNADTVQFPFPQVYGALRNHRVDGEENPIATILSAKLYEVQTYLTLTGHIYDPAIILMSQDAFDALSDDDKQAFKAAAKLAAAESRKIASEKETEGIADLKAHGMVVETVFDKAAFVNRASVASPIFEKEFGRDVMEGIKKAAAAVHRRMPEAAPDRDPQ